MKNAFSNEQIQVVMEKSGITRKSALKKLGKMTPKELAALIPATSVTPRNAAIALNQENALKPEVAADYKARAANDDTEQPVAPKAKTPEPPKPVVPQTAAGSARAEGIRLYKLSNVATLAKDEGVKTEVLFKHVYGPMGAKWTWEQRAKAVGLATAEEAAREFQRMRGGKPQEFVKAEPTTEKK